MSESATSGAGADGVDARSSTRDAPAALLGAVVAVAPTLRVTSSVNGSIFRASTGNYVFEGEASQGDIAISWRVVGTGSEWVTSIVTSADPAGRFRAEMDIGPWLTSYEWRATSLGLAAVQPSNVVRTDILPGATLNVVSSTTGSRFLGGSGNYLFSGDAPPGAVAISWRVTGSSSPWVTSVAATADAFGRYQAEMEIGPWVSSYDWRAVSLAEAALAPSNTVTTDIRPGLSLDVGSSVGGSTFRAGTGSYLFEGDAPPGEVAISWRVSGTSSSWVTSVVTVADTSGRFRAEMRIGPWENSYDWRVTSLSRAHVGASNVVRTVILPGVTMKVASSTTGSSFVAGSGNYVFSGDAPPGAVAISWRVTGSSSAWVTSVAATADASGWYRAELGIGPWVTSYDWRATSLAQPALTPSNIRQTDIRPVSMTHRVRGAILADLGAAYRSGCPVGPSGLSVITMNHWGFDGVLRDGELIVRNQDVSKVVASFSAAFDVNFPIRKMVNPRYYTGAQDELMMEDDNTSGFNCRQVVGNPYRMSPHSYGYAVDINPRENPYYAGGVWYPSSGSAYISRGTRRPGMHFSDTVLPRQFTSRGGHWGGLYSDYHHFETVPR